MILACWPAALPTFRSPLGLDHTEVEDFRRLFESWSFYDQRARKFFTPLCCIHNSDFCSRCWSQLWHQSALSQPTPYVAHLYKLGYAISYFCDCHRPILSPFKKSTSTSSTTSSVRHLSDFVVSIFPWFIFILRSMAIGHFHANHRLFRGRCR